MNTMKMRISGRDTKEFLGKIRYRGCGQSILENGCVQESRGEYYFPGTRMLSVITKPQKFDEPEGKIEILLAVKRERDLSVKYLRKQMKNADLCFEIELDHRYKRLRP